MILILFIICVILQFLVPDLGFQAILADPLSIAIGGAGLIAGGTSLASGFMQADAAR